MTTRQTRLDYFLLNDGSDHEALPEDRISEIDQSEVNSSIHIPSEILPSESVSQTLTSPILASSPSNILRSRSQNVHALPLLPIIRGLL